MRIKTCAVSTRPFFAVQQPGIEASRGSYLSTKGARSPIPQYQGKPLTDHVGCGVVVVGYIKDILHSHTQCMHDLSSFLSLSLLSSHQ